MFELRWVAAACAGAMVICNGPVLAQNATPAVAAPDPAAGGNGCELHVWPTENYVGMNSGLLSGLGPIGVVADLDAHKNRVRTVKDRMRDYLGPDIQIAGIE